MKLWQKENNGSSQNSPSGKVTPLGDGGGGNQVEIFTIGNDRDFDLQLAPFDVLGSIAHAKMLAAVGLISNEEAEQLISALRNIYAEIEAGKFSVDNKFEDIHSQVEFLLTEKLGNAGKKIHAARSRNDQVLLDIKLFLRHEIEVLVTEVYGLFKLLQQKSERYKSHLLPGYTHLQLAMPSSFGLWFGAYAEGLVDDVITLQAAYEIVNKNPLGSAAGYGSSFPIDRELTTKLLGFGQLNHNVVYAQMGRGKTERITAQALSNIADTLARLSMDACLFLNQNFDFISFPAELTTGSSIMPHKKNPDVFELIRSHCNRVKALPNEIMMMTTNLPSGYHRDLQLLKESLFPAFSTLKDCIRMTSLMLQNISVKENILEDDKYRYLFSVEAVNELVLQGVPFREAYQSIAADIASGNFKWDKPVEHTHEGSIGNLQTAAIAQMMHNALQRFDFAKATSALRALAKT